MTRTPISELIDRTAIYDRLHERPKYASLKAAFAGLEREARDFADIYEEWVRRSRQSPFRE